MGKGSYSGGGTVVGPRDAGWFGKGDGGVKAGKRPDSSDITRRQSAPLTAQAERQISNLRVDLAGLKRELIALDNAREPLRKKIAGSESDLAALLHQHGLPLDPGLARPVQNHGPNLAKRDRA